MTPNNWIKNWLQKTAEREYEQDLTKDSLEELLEEGYDTVELVTPASACDKCTSQAGTVSIADLLRNLNPEYNAPLFSWTHVGCNSCYFVVSSSENDELTPKIVNRDGTIEDQNK